MTPRRRVTVAERRARLGRRHRLAAPAGGVPEAARSTVVLHATDPVTVFLSIHARRPQASIAEIEHAFWEDRSVFRMLAMRRTMFAVPVELAPVVHAAAGRSVAAAQRRRLLGWLAEARVAANPEGWLREVEETAIAALRRRGEALATELAEDEPRLRQKIVLGAGQRFEATTPVSYRVLLVMAAEGRIGRGRPQGRWSSTRYRWAPIESWWPEGLPELETAAAQAELARLWLAAFGPGTAADLRWWTGWTMGETRRALAALETVEVELETGETGVLLASDQEEAPAPAPWVALLPSLDPTVMGWAGREWYLGEHRARLFDRNGNAGPTIWAGGRVIGGWAQRRDGEIAIRLLEDAGRETVVAVEEAAGRLAEFLGPARFTPSFQTPTEKELRA